MGANMVPAICICRKTGVGLCKLSHYAIIRLCVRLIVGRSNGANMTATICFYCVKLALDFDDCLDLFLG